MQHCPCSAAITTPLRHLLHTTNYAHPAQSLQYLHDISCLGVFNAALDLFLEEEGKPGKSMAAFIAKERPFYFIHGSGKCHFGNATGSPGVTKTQQVRSSSAAFCYLPAIHRPCPGRCRG